MSRRSLGLAICGLPALIAAALSAAGPEAVAQDTADPRPNVIVVLSDDQHPATLERMPYLNSRPDWLQFENAITNLPLCCPARASLLTGLNAHHHGIERNEDAPEFDRRRTVADWLQAAGYETAYFGKYLNAFPWGKPPGYIPNGWDHWVAFSGKQGYESFQANDNGTVTYYPGTAVHADDLFAGEAIEYVSSAEGPYFAFVSFFGPHEPWSAPARHAYAEVEPYPSRPSLNEKNVRDKPLWVRRLPLVDAVQMEADLAGQERSLLAVDDAIRGIFAALEANGQLDNTIVIYSTDNGFSLGEHRHFGKSCAYEECVNVPLLIRGPGIGPGSTGAPVSNIDLAPTIADYAEAAALDPVDGHTLRPLLEGERKNIRSGVLITRPDGARATRFWGIRTKSFKYVEYRDQADNELYDLRVDPHELRSVAGKRAYVGRERRLARRLKALRKEQPRCGAGCEG